MQRDPLPRPVPSHSLTPAQIEFARLLGRILAERWEREHPPPTRPVITPSA